MQVKTSISAGFDVGVLLVIDHNRQIVDNAISGIELDATSGGNSIVRNTISGSPTDVVDAGTGNCWRNNTFGTGSVPACP